MKQQFKRALLSTFLASTLLTAPSFAQEWKAVILPASINSDQTIRLVSEQTQLLTFTLQADDAVTKQGKTHKIELEFDLPPGLSIAHQQGYFKLTEKSRTSHNGRDVIRYDAEVDNASIIGKPGARISTEWRVHSFFVDTPEKIPLGHNFLQFKVIDGEKTQNFEWPIALEPLAKPQQRAKTPLGLWSYNYQRAQNDAAARGIAEFLSSAGINFVQAATDATYRKALQSQNILTGGNTHHSVFYKKDYQDVNAGGTAVTGNFSDPTSVINLPENAEIPGARQLIENARAGDGIATYDYEPTGRNGFTEIGIKTFRDKYDISEADFKTFREYVAKNGLQTHLSEDPLISKIWAQWTEFRSEQTSNYVRRITEAVKAQAPDVRIAVTPSRSYGHGTKSTLALGTDNAAMAQYTDIIMPQLYSGYGAANAKRTMDMVEGWRAELTKQSAKTELWPLLLVRYAGASVSNSPQRLYQQSIGSIAHGANGLLFYYPGNMDAPYWNMVAKLNENLAKYEDFYHDGKRVDEQFQLSKLPVGETQVNVYPGYPETVENPGWAFTAHQLGTKVLLTLINLEEANDLVFGVDVGNAKYISGENVEALSGPLSTTLEEQVIPISGQNEWLVTPGQVGFIVLDRS